jgi:WD40 repeat protein
MFSPDGRFILTVGGVDARLWEAEPRGPAFDSLSHTQRVGPVAFSPDGRRILTGTGLPFPLVRGEARLWDATTLQPIGPALTHKLPAVCAVAFSPDGRLFVTGSGHPYRGPGEAQLWDAGTREPRGHPLQLGGAVISAAFSPEGKEIVLGLRTGPEPGALIWDVAAGKVDPLPHGDGVDDVAYSRDGKRILTGCEDGKARLWDARSRQCVREFDHGGSVVGVAFSPDGKRILTGCEDGTARLWDVDTGRLRLKKREHQGWVRAVAFSPDGRQFLTGGGDKTVRLWDADTGASLSAPFSHGSRVVSATFIPEGWVVSATFSPDGRKILTGSLETIARLWDAEPAPVEGEPERIRHWAQALTGLEADSGGSVRVLEGHAWRECCRRLNEEGGPPVATVAETRAPSPLP